MRLPSSRFILAQFYRTEFLQHRIVARHPWFWVTLIWAFMAGFQAAPAHAQDLNWSTDVGAVGYAGDSSFDAATGAYHIKGAGIGLSGSADAFHFAYYEVVRGDGQMVVRVSSADALAQVALVIRESLDANAASAASAVRNGSAQFIRRALTGNNATIEGAAGVNVPCWLKLVRSGGTVSTFTSADGQNWTSLGAGSVTLANPTVYIGFAVSNGASGATGTVMASFDGIQSTFLPNEGLALWLKADAGLTQDATGRVSAWADQSGLGHDAVQSTSTNQPQAVAAVMNGQPVIRFDGSNGYLQLPATFNNFGQGFTALVVARPTNVGNWQSFFDLGNGGSSSNLLLARKGTADTLALYGNNPGFELDAPGAIALNTCQLFECTQSANTVALYKNGLLLTSGTGGATNNVTGTSNLIAKDNWGDAPFQGDIAEIVFFNRVLTDAQRQAWESYLNAKYAFAAPPPVPTQFAAAQPAATQIKLTWNENPSATVTGYQLERQNTDGTWSVIAVLGPDTLSYVDHNVALGTTYHYRVSALNAYGSSAPSSDLAFATNPNAGEAPQDPANPEYNWSDSDQPGGPAYVWNDISTTGTLLTGISDADDVNQQVNFSFSFPFFNATYSSVFVCSNGFLTFGTGSSQVSHGPLPSTGMPPNLLAPLFTDLHTGISGEVYALEQNGRLTIQFNHVALYGGSSANTYTFQVVLESSGRITYYYQTLSAATNIASVGLQSGDNPPHGRQVAYNQTYLHDALAVQFHNLAAQAPSTPAQLSATSPTSTQVVLSWTEASVYLSGYRVERQDPGGTWSLVASPAARSTSYVDGGLNPSTAYSYRVTAYNDMGSSPTSSVASTTTQPAGGTLPASLPAIDALALWLSADKGVTKDANNSVSTWADASGHGNNAYAQAGWQPTWIAGALNGQPTIRFDGGSSYLQLPGGFSDFTQGMTVLLVTKPSSSANSARFFDLGNDGGTGDILLARLGTSDALGFYSQNSTFEVDTTTGLVLNQFALLEATQNPAVQLATVYRNGVALASTTAGPIANVARTANFIARCSYSVPYFAGDIAEMLLFDRALNDAERQAWENYLSSKYNYASAPPAPAQLAVTAMSATQVAISWVDAFQDITGYRVERRNVDGTWSVVAQPGPGTTSYVVTGLAPGMAYAFRVVATNRMGDSPVAGASVTTPTDGASVPVANLRLWLRSDSGTVPDGNGGVTQWLDRSGHNNDARQTDAGKDPHSVVDQGTGLTVVRFDGTGSEMNLPNLMDGAAEGELFVVHRAAANPGGAAAQGWHDFGGDNPYYYKYFPADDAQVYDSFGTNVRKSTGKPAAALDQFHLYDAASKPGEWTSRFNGRLHYTTADNTVGFNAAPRLGVTGAYNHHFAGDVAEVMVFDRVLNASEREVVGRYLTQRYNLTPVPDVPSSAQASAISSSQISLAWTQTAPVGGTVVYTLERQAGGAFVPVAEVQDATSFLDTGLSPGTTYTYRITARGYAGVPVGSVSVSATTLPANSVEAAAMPTDSIRLWLKGDSGLGFGSIDTWVDQSGLGNHARQAIAANQPQVQADVVNHRPVVHFDGVNGELGLPNLMDGAAEGELFVVHRAAANPGGAAAQGWHDFGGDNPYYNKYFPADDAQVYDSFGTTARKSTGKPAAALDQFHLYDAASKPGEWTSRFNGRLHYTTADNTVGFNAAPRLGVTGAYNHHFAGDVAEVIVYSRVLSEAERQAVGRYLNAKYALVASVPDAPSAVAVQALSPTQATVFWQEANGGDGAVIYTIERRGSDGSYVLIAQVTDVTSFVDTGLSPGVTYTYRITAHNWVGDSNVSQEVSVALPATNPYLADMPTSGLKLWLRADAGVSAGAVDLWRDQSGNSNHARQGYAANQPTLVPNALNGRPVVRFDGQQSSLDLPGIFNGLTQGELLIVHRATPPANGGDNGWHDFGSDNPYYYKYYATGDGQICDSFGTNARKDTGAPSQSTATFHLYDAASKPGEWTSRVNGALHYTTPDNTVSFSSSPRLGVNSAYNRYFKGDVAEILIYDHVLSESERTAVGRYLDAKYQFIPLPAPPTALTATALSPTQVSLTWTASFGNAQTYYEIERKGAQDPDFVPFAAVAQSASYIDTGLNAGTTYLYRVRAHNYAGYSAYTDPSSVTLPAAGQGAEMPLTGIRLWLKADAGAGADSVANWVDQSGNGGHAHQNLSVAQPKLSAQTINGRPAVQFDGQQSALYLPNVMANCNAGELFIVHRNTADPTADNGWHDFGTGNPYYVRYYANSDGRIYDNFGTTTRKDTGAPALPLSQWHLYNVTSQTGDWTSRLNGFVHFTTSDNTVGFTESPRLGLDSAYDKHFKGDVAEMLIYDHVLSDGERETVGRYLLTKYSLAVAPAPPANVTASVVSATQAELTWGAVGGAGYSVIYTVERQGLDGTWTVVLQSADLTSFLDGGLQPGTTYNYRVTARNGVGTSGYSQVFSVTTPSAASPSAAAMPTAGLRLWLRADAGLGADGVNTWLDQSGLGNHARQNYRINLPSLVYNAVHGRPVVRFDGQNSELNLPNFMDGATAGELFIVHRSTADPTVDNGWHDFGTGNPYYVRYYANSDGRIYDNFGTTTRKDTGAPSLPINLFHLYNVTSQTGDWTSRLNGGVHYHTDDNTVGFPSGGRLGAASAYNQHFKGDVAEVLIYDHALSDTEREAVGRYLNDKYAMESVPAAPSAPASAYTPTAYAISPTQVNVTWSETSVATTQGSIIYTVERKPASGPISSYAQVGTVKDGTSYLDGNCAPGGTYTYRVCARNYAGISGYGPESTASTPVGSASNSMPVADLKLWLKADAGIGPDGLNVWIDQSGNGNHAWQVARAGMPAKQEGLVNGRPAVRFDGQASELYFRDFLSSLPAGELFIVHRSGADPGVANGWHDFGDDRPYYSGKYYPYSDGKIYDSFGTNARKDSPAVARTDLRSFHLYNSRSSVDGWASGIDENILYSTNSNTVGFPTQPRLGVNSAYNVHFKGDVAEVLIFDRVLTPTERHIVEEYLGVKYLLPGVDSDEDGLTNGQELALGTNPFNPDTNGDGLSDGVSVQLGINPVATGGFLYTTPPSPTGSGGGGTPPADPNDHTPPVITLTAPANAVPIP